MLPEEKQKLLDYIKTAIDVETDIETQNQISAEYQTWIAAKEPILIKKEPQKPAYLDESGNDKGVAGFGIGMGILMGIGGFLSMVAMPESLILIIFGLIVVALSIWMIKVGADRIRYIKEHNNNEAIAFWKRTEKIKSENAENEKRYYQNHAEWQKLREEIDKKLEMPHQQSLDIREKFYARDVIYPKYQNLPALTSIYEYFITGRCEELIGPHGAYNMYEDEMRKDTVISQLNTVIANLEQIKQNQYMLYQQVKAIQNTASEIGNELAQIRGYTAALTELSAMNAYYNAVSARNSRIMTAYHLLP
ncbi:MAG: hypothetical protein V8Q82_02770 [Christensenellales bacterium]